jgi:galactokinase
VTENARTLEAAVALADAPAAPALAAAVARDYEAEVGLRPALYVCTAAEGASVERLDGGG